MNFTYVKPKIHSCVSGKMGSSFSIVNDTNHDIWVWEDVNVEAILYSVSGVFVVGGLAAAAATVGASVAAGTAAGTASAAAAAAGNHIAY